MPIHPPGCSAASNSVVGVPDASALSFTSDFSVEAWVRTTNAGVIAAKDPGSEQTCTGAFGDLPPTYELLPHGWAISVDSSGLIRAEAAGGQTRTECGFQTVESTAYGPAIGVVNDGEWHHVVVCFQQSSISIWVDGTVQTTNEGGVVSSAGTPMDIGGALGDGYPGFTGDIDEVALYPGALTSAQVGAHLAAGLPDAEHYPNVADESPDPLPNDPSDDYATSWDAPPNTFDPAGAGSVQINRDAAVAYVNQYVG